MVNRKTSASGNPDAQRHLVLDALLASPDVQAVLRLTLVENLAEKTLVVAATVSMIETLPVYVISHALDDARRRVKAIVGEDSEVFIEPDLVKDPDRVEPATDVIVIRASD